MYENRKQNIFEEIGLDMSAVPEWLSYFTISMVGLQLQLQLMTVKYYTAEGWPVYTKLAG